jgi:DNA-binding NarL/FixJ family response regulator
VLDGDQRRVITPPSKAMPVKKPERAMNAPTGGQAWGAAAGDPGNRDGGRDERDHAVFGAALAQRLRTLFADGPTRSEASFPELTDRERLILDKLAAGLTNVEIGRALFLSPKTVANNVSVILAKLNLSERGQAIVLARDAGLGRSISD